MKGKGKKTLHFKKREKEENSRMGKKRLKIEPSEGGKKREKLPPCRIELPSVYKTDALPLSYKG